MLCACRGRVKMVSRARVSNLSPSRLPFVSLGCPFCLPGDRDGDREKERETKISIFLHLIQVLHARRGHTPAETLVYTTVPPKLLFFATPGIYSAGLSAGPPGSTIGHPKLPGLKAAHCNPDG